MKAGPLLFAGVLVAAIVSSFAFGVLTSPYIMPPDSAVREIFVTVTSTREETVTVTTTVTITGKPFKFNESSCVVLRTGKESYKVSETVSIVLENRCDSVLILPNPAPWLIKDSKGEIVFSPISIQVIKEVGPGGVVTWSWPQRDNMGAPVGAGEYHVELMTLNAGTLVTRFWILEN